MWEKGLGVYATEESIHTHVHNLDCCRAIQCEFKRGCTEQRSRGQYTSEPFRCSLKARVWEAISHPDPSKRWRLGSDPSRVYKTVFTPGCSTLISRWSVSWKSRNSGPKVFSRGIILMPCWFCIRLDSSPVSVWFSPSSFLRRLSARHALASLFSVVFTALFWDVVSSGGVMSTLLHSGTLSVSSRNMSVSAVCSTSRKSSLALLVPLSKDRDILWFPRWPGPVAVRACDLGKASCSAWKLGTVVVDGVSTVAWCTWITWELLRTCPGDKKMCTSGEFVFDDGLESVSPTSSVFVLMTCCILLTSVWSNFILSFCFCKTCCKGLKSASDLGVRKLAAVIVGHTIFLIGPINPARFDVFLPCTRNIKKDSASQFEIVIWRESKSDQSEIFLQGLLFSPEYMGILGIWFPEDLGPNSYGRLRSETDLINCLTIKVCIICWFVSLPHFLLISHKPVSLFIECFGVHNTDAL